VLTSVTCFDARMSDTRAKKIAYVMVWSTKHYPHDQMRGKEMVGHEEHMREMENGNNILVR